MNWKAWLKGLAAAAIGGATTGTAQVVSTTGTVNKGTGAVAGVGALVGAIAYLMKSPLPGMDGKPVVEPLPVKDIPKE